MRKNIKIKIEIFQDHLADNLNNFKFFKNQTISPWRKFRLPHPQKVHRKRMQLFHESLSSFIVNSKFFDPRFFMQILLNLSLVSLVACGSEDFIFTTTPTQGSSSEPTIIDNEVTSISGSIEINPLNPLAPENEDNYPVTGFCESDLGDVTIVVGKPDVEVNVPCKSNNTFAGSLNVVNVSSNPATVTVSQYELNPVMVAIANNMNHFVTLWRFSVDNYTFQIPLKNKSELVYNFIVDWGDETPLSEVTSFDDPNKIHTYEKAGNYIVTITGICEGFQNTRDADHSGPHTLNLRKVLNLGHMGWKNLSSAFARNSKLTNILGGNLSQVTNMSYMFAHSELANPDTSGWDTSQVTNMRSMFKNTHIANPNTSGWDTSQVTNMSYMFAHSELTNPDTSGWDTSRVKHMHGMFLTATKANPDVSNWDTSQVINMTEMFNLARKAEPNVSNWNTSKVTDMNNMFHAAAYANPDVSNWDVSQVTNMRYMFHLAHRANPDTSGWDISQVTDFSNLFLNSGLNVENYSKFLIRLNEVISAHNYTTTVPTKFINTHKNYNSTAVESRTNLMANGWTFTDGNLENSN